MSYLVYLTLLPPFLIGVLLVSWLFLPSRKGNILLFLSLGIPLGFGITACLFFLWAYLFNPSFPGYWLVEVVLLSALFYLTWKQRQHLVTVLPDFKKWQRIDWMAAGLFTLVALIALGSFIAYTTANPHGRYDAWAIWNVRARMLARGGIDWKSVFVPQIFHADYPLLVPLTIARCWVLAGTESIRIPSAVAGLFTFAPAGILIGTLLNLGKKQMSWLAGILFLSTPWVIYFGSLQFADLPLAACIAAAAACLSLALTDRGNASRWLALAGLSSGLAAWTKNEGQLFLVVFVLVSIPAIFLVFRHRKPLNLLLKMGIGLALPLIALLLFKLTLAPANDVVDMGNLNPAFSQLLSPARYVEVIKAYQSYPKGFGSWVVPIPLVFLIVWLLLKPRVNNENRSAVLVLAGLLIFQWLGYFFIYVITPRDLQSHINQSYDRLLMQLFPTFILFMFLFLTAPEKIFKSADE
ncbi:MAG: hypothetical protein GYA15_09260 [Leptolinea sp.]|jgi:4-amino-4-deoxy-L-arabinose transferase-like glycosyltransferase|nr:hypothetical protein [Leptolinea sp.]